MLHLLKHYFLGPRTTPRLNNDFNLKLICVLSQIFIFIFFEN